jgi:DNA-binding protein HU-beta
MAKKAAAKKAPAKAAAKAPAKAKAASATTTVTLKHMAATLAEEHELSKRQAEAVLTGMIDLVVKNLKKGARIRIAGLGILSVRKRAARMGRNPATGEAIKIKASKKVGFRVAKDLKEAI